MSETVEIILGGYPTQAKTTRFGLNNKMFFGGRKLV
jgi:hypothetical protein